MDVHFLYDRYAAIYKMSCVPKDASKKHSSLTEMAKERNFWTPLDDYGNDSVYCISPPLVSRESRDIYDQCASSYKTGVFFVEETDKLVYDTFNECYPGDERDITQTATA